MVDYNNLEEQEFYMEQVMDNFKNPKNFGKLQDFDLFRHQKNPSCGDTFDIYIKIDNNKKIIDVKYEGNGCAISTASISLLSEKLKNMSLIDANSLNDKDIYELIGIKITPTRINCAMLSINALKNSIKDSKIFSSK